MLQREPMVRIRPSWTHRKCSGGLLAASIGLRGRWNWKPISLFGDISGEGCESGTGTSVFGTLGSKNRMPRNRHADKLQLIEGKPLQEWRHFYLVQTGGVSLHRVEFCEWLAPCSCGGVALDCGSRTLNYWCYLFGCFAIDRAAATKQSITDMFIIPAMDG